MFSHITKLSVSRIISSSLSIICFLLLSGTMFDDLGAIQSEKTAASVTLNWTAPGDNGNTGTASAYDLRYSTTEITENNWASASQATGEPYPGTAGTTEEFTLSLDQDTLYYFAIKAVDLAGNWSGLSNNDTARIISLITEVIIPGNYALSQNYPNPFNAATVINYHVPVAGPVKLLVLDILGRTVSTIVDQELTVGDHTATWDGRDGDGKPAATGMYFYNLRAGKSSTSRKMILLK